MKNNFFSNRLKAAVLAIAAFSFFSTGMMAQNGQTAKSTKTAMHTTAVQPSHSITHMQAEKGKTTKTGVASTEKAKTATATKPTTQKPKESKVTSSQSKTSGEMKAKSEGKTTKHKKAKQHKAKVKTKAKTATAKPMEKSATH
ncbi:MAG TPA: hypothetical protein VFM99_11535 [Chitinophagales bacterium]|nr:hypothetical protein [Chitinophagales bacterium]